MGVVFRARDLRLDRTVAIKVLSPGTDSEWTERLGREARSGARLTDPNIVSVFEYGVDADEGAYLVREFVDGESLADVLQRGPLPLADALAVAAGVCSALVAAHESGVIHRDIKPSNVLIPKGCEFDRAKLSDFGLGGRLGHQTGLTRSGEIFGTPIYMSPEQLRGEPQSAATDLYGLGVLLYEMLFGFTPFRGDLRELVTQVLHQAVPFPDSRPMPAAVRTLLADLLAKTPDNRPGSAQEVLSRLRALNVRTAEARVTAKVETDTVPSSPGVSPVSIGTSAPAASARSSQSRWSLPLAFAAIVAALGLVMMIVLVRGAGVAFGVIGGVAIGASGVVLAGFLSRRLNALRPAIADEASRVLLGAERRHLLTQSLAIDVDKLVSKCRDVDQCVLGKTLALAVDQLQHATSSADQLAILPTVVSITTQLSERLTPWYVRYEKLLAFFVALVGLVTGIATAINALP
jgi:serine/threonine-protein kinase